MTFNYQTSLQINYFITTEIGMLFIKTPLNMSFVDWSPISNYILENHLFIIRQIVSLRWERFVFFPLTIIGPQTTDTDRCLQIVTLRCWYGVVLSLVSFSSTRGQTDTLWSHIWWLQNSVTLCWLHCKRTLSCYLNKPAVIVSCSVADVTNELCLIPDSTTW